MNARQALTKVAALTLFYGGGIWFSIYAVHGLWNLDLVALSRSLIGALAYKAGTRLHKMYYLSRNLDPVKLLEQYGISVTDGPETSGKGYL